MITITDEYRAWSMTIDINTILNWIQNDSLRKYGYTISKARKIYKLIMTYADPDTVDALNSNIDMMPKVKEKLIRRRS